MASINVYIADEKDFDTKASCRLHHDAMVGSHFWVYWVLGLGIRDLGFKYVRIGN